jgi:hypothetical protein
VANRGDPNATPPPRDARTRSTRSDSRRRARRRPGPAGERQSRRPFLERPVAVVTLVGGLLGIVTATLTVLGFLGGGDAQTAEQRIATCVAEHGLSSSVTKTQTAPGRMLFRSCVWPPPPGAANDGFTEITVASRDGPGQSEAEGLTVADVYTTSCRDIEVRYLFDNMGTFVPEEPVRLTKGEIRRVEGGSIWFPRNEREASIYTPRRDEFVVLSARRYRLDTARCVG